MPGKHVRSYSNIMASFENALTKTLRNEGGYVNDPDDPGGETYKGVARNLHSSWEGWSIVDSSKRQTGFPANLEHNEDLQDKVKLFYKTKFWDRILGDQITDEHVGFAIFDFGVNAGISTSAALAQQVVDVNSDGVVGPTTINAINAMNPEHFIASFTIAKIVRYVAIVNKRPTSRKFFFGWISRAINY